MRHAILKKYFTFLKITALIFLASLNAQAEIFGQQRISANIAQLVSPPAIIPHVSSGSMGGYYTYGEIERRLDSLHQVYPHILSTKFSIGSTTEDRPIWCVRISDNPDSAEDEPKILYTAMHHANEPAGMMQMLYFIEYLLNGYAQDAGIRYLLDSREIYCVPVVNPDGYVYNQVHWPNGGGMWRKNRDSVYYIIVDTLPKSKCATSDTQRIYIGGIDLDRNYSYFFVADSLVSDFTHGAWPFQARETRAIRDLCLSRHFQMALNYHSSNTPFDNNYILYPWMYNSRPTADSGFYRYFNSTVLEYMSNFKTGQFQTLRHDYNPAVSQSYPSGTADDWMYGESRKNKIYSMAVVTGRGYWPDAQDIQKIARECLSVNLLATWMAGIYPVIQSVGYQSDSGTPFVNPGESARVYVRYSNRGIGVTRDSVRVTLSSSDSNVVVTDSVSVLGTISGYGHFSNEGDPFAFFLRPTAGRGRIITMHLTFHIDDALYHAAFEFVTGTPVWFIHDSASSITGWQAEGGWGLHADAYSPPAAFTDSPGRLYYNHALSTLINKAAISLAGMVMPRLEFQTKWDIEPRYDFATVSISTNGGRSWVYLRGTHARRASGKAPAQADTSVFGYDSTQTEWVREVIDLRDFSGQDSINIRFQLQTDGWIVADGWYLDDIRLYGYPVEEKTIQPSSGAIAMLPNYPNPFNPSTTLQFFVHEPTEITMTLYNILGQKVGTLINKKRYERGLHRQEWNGRNDRGFPVSSGVYIVRIEGKHGTDTRKILLLK